jgi:hypothetical protein
MTTPLHSGWRHLELLFGRRQKEQALLQSSRHRDADLAGKMIVAAARKPQVASFGIESHPPAARHSITARCDARAISSRDTAQESSRSRCEPSILASASVPIMPDRSDGNRPRDAGPGEFISSGGIELRCFGSNFD